jgi:hypothetical protein
LCLIFGWFFVLGGICSGFLAEWSFFQVFGLSAKTPDPPKPPVKLHPAKNREPTKLLPNNNTQKPTSKANGKQHNHTQTYQQSINNTNANQAFGDTRRYC